MTGYPRPVAGARPAGPRANLIIAFLFLAPYLPAAGPSISSISHNAPMNRYDKFELTFTLGTSYSNPFDPALIDARVVFSGPGALSFTTTAFPYQGYTRSGSTAGQTLTPSGSLVWKARFAPTVAGSWTYTIYATDGTGTSQSTAGSPFSVNASSKRGFIRASAADPRYFAYDDGSSYFALGENMGWSGTGRTYDYDQWVGGLSAEGGNFIRVWQAPWHTEVEWDYSYPSAGLPGNYSARQREAWELDYILDLCDADGVKVMLCLINHGKFSSTTNPNWDDNPYSSAANPAGFLSSPDQVWTNATAQFYLQRLWRYYAARYAYSTALMSWEFWNEMEWTDNYAAQAANSATWHQNSKNFLRSIDPHQHLITTSYADAESWPAAVWNSGMELTQAHHYGSKDLAALANAKTQAMLALHPAKPFVLGEFGFDVTGNAATMIAQDPSGLHMHNAHWASFMSKAAGSGFTWWWDNYVHPQNLYFRYLGLANFIAGEDLDQRAYAPVIPAVSTATRADYGASPAFGSFSGAAPANSFSVDPAGSITPSESSLGAFLHGTWQAASRNPPTFSVNYAVAGNFSVVIDSVSPSTPQQIKINLDGGPVELTQNVFAAGGTFSIAVPAGAHTIFVDSSSVDWLHVGEYRFSNYSPILRSFALRGTGRAMGWVQSRNNTYWRQCASCQGGSAMPLPTVSDGVAALTGLSQDGSWNVEWWDTVTGALASTGTASASGGAMNLNVPSLNTDLAFKLSFAFPTTPTFSPSKTLSPSPSITRTFTATPSASPSPTRTASPSSTPSQSPSATPFLSPSPSFTLSVSPSPSPTGSATPSPTPSFTDVPPGSSMTATPSSTPSFTESPTLTFSPQDSATFSGTPSSTPPDTATPSPLASATETATPAPSASLTPSPSLSSTSAALSPTPTPPPPSATPPASSFSPGEVVKALPSFNPAFAPLLDLSFKLSGGAEEAELKIYSPAYTLVRSLKVAGPYYPGWNRLRLNETELSSGLWYYELRAYSGGAPTGKAVLGKLYFLK